METIQEALTFEENIKTYKNCNERIQASLKSKELILVLNEYYKKSTDKQLMDIMKRLTLVKLKFESRLKPKIIIKIPLSQEA